MEDTLILNYNRIGTDFARKNQLDSAVTFFLKALNLASESKEFQSIILNNLGGVLKRMGRFQESLRYLREALDIQRSLVMDRLTVSGTHLNLCAVYSCVGDHITALQHAQTALHLLKNKQEHSEILCIAYHNAALELEFLERFQEASLFYKKGSEIASLEHYEIGHELHRGLANTIKNVSGKTDPLIRRVANNEDKRRLKSARKTASKPKNDVNCLKKQLYQPNIYTSFIDREVQKLGGNDKIYESCACIQKAFRQWIGLIRTKELFYHCKRISINIQIAFRRFECKNRVSEKVSFITCDELKTERNKILAVLFSKLTRKFELNRIYMKWKNSHINHRDNMVIPKETHGIQMNHASNPEKRNIQERIKNDIIVAEILKIQSHFRSFSIKIELHSLKYTKNKAAILIQKQIRRYIARKHLKQLKMSALAIEQQFILYDKRKHDSFMQEIDKTVNYNSLDRASRAISFEPIIEEFLHTVSSKFPINSLAKPNDNLAISVKPSHFNHKNGQSRKIDRDKLIPRQANSLDPKINKRSQLKRNNEFKCSKRMSESNAKVAHVICIQTTSRALIARLKVKKYQQISNIQKYMRHYLAYRLVSRIRSVTTIQSFFRYFTSSKFIIRYKAVTLVKTWIQHLIRSKLLPNNFDHI